MITPNLTPQQVDQISGLLAQYIATERERFASRAIPLSDELKIAFAGFFSTALLENSGILILTDERVANPQFYPMLENLGFNNLPQMPEMSAITFVDTVVAHGQLTGETLFHELVHVEQYRQLGITKFSALYVRGFLSGGGYYGIPLEVNAYTLARRYEADHAHVFSVADDVAARIAADSF